MLQKRVVTDVGDHAYELLMRVHEDVADVERELVTNRARLSSLDQHFATMTGDLAQIRSELDDMRADLSHIRRRLDLVEA